MPRLFVPGYISEYIDILRYAIYLCGWNGHKAKLCQRNRKQIISNLALIFWMTRQLKVTLIGEEI